MRFAHFQLPTTLKAAMICALLVLVAPAGALAEGEGPVAVAQAMVVEGKKLIKKAKRKRGKKKPKMLAEGLKKFARAYLMLTTRKLQNDAPDLLQEISDQIAATNRLPLVAQMRRDLLAKAIDASVAGKLTEAYDFLASLRDLDPREWTVEYALGVLGQRMEGG